jgi:hypothetical protein
MIAALTYFSEICGTKFSKKCNFFKKPRINGLSTGLPPSRKAPARQDGGAGRQRADASRGALLLREKLPRTTSRMPEERNPNTDAECGQIQCIIITKANSYILVVSLIAASVAKIQTNQRDSGLLDSNENWVTDLDQAD